VGGVSSYERLSRSEWNFLGNNLVECSFTEAWATKRPQPWAQNNLVWVGLALAVVCISFSNGCTSSHSECGRMLYALLTEIHASQGCWGTFCTAGGNSLSIRDVEGV
jgi:hypothetical protein